MSEEEIDKLLKSLEEISSFIGIDKTNPQEMILINENIAKSNLEMIKLIKEQNGRWIDIYTQIKNPFCKVLIKNLTDKNFITLQGLEKNRDEILENIEEFKKKI